MNLHRVLSLEVPIEGSGCVDWTFAFLLTPPQLIGFVGDLVKRPASVAVGGVSAIEIQGHDEGLILTGTTQNCPKTEAVLDNLLILLWR